MIQLITSGVVYNGGMFPKIPERVSGQDTLLVSGDGIARIVDDAITTRDIRKGNYNKLVRISTLPFSLGVTLKATSKNAPYRFNVAVGVECRVVDSVAYYTNKAAYDIENSISTTMSRVVTPEAKKYELTDNRVDSALIEKLMSQDEYYLEALGITYIVHSVDVEPDAEAASFIKQMTDSTLNVRVEKHKASEAEKLTSRNMESAIMTQVASGKIDMKTALEELSNTNRKEGYSRIDDIEHLINFVRKLQEDNIITDAEAGERINDFIRRMPAYLSSNGTPMAIKAPQSEERAKSQDNDDTLDELFSNEDKG